MEKVITFFIPFDLETLLSIIFASLRGQTKKPRVCVYNSKKKKFTEEFLVIEKKLETKCVPNQLMN